MGRGFTYDPGYLLTPGQPPPGLSYPPASPHRLPTTPSGPSLPANNQARRPRRRIGWSASEGSVWARARGYGNINPLSIDYALRPRLRPRLTLGGKACPRNPWSSGAHVSHVRIATHACILTPAPSTPVHTWASPDTGRSPTHHPTRRQCHGFGGVLEPRYIVGAESLDQ